MNSARVAVRTLLVALVLATVALVPSVARAHDRLTQQPTPAQQHSRFRWSNSCESVPQKVTTVAIVAPLADSPHVAVQPPQAPATPAPVDDVSRPPSAPLASPQALRAPPTSIA
jgi:hypothetical protein